MINNLNLKIEEKILICKNNDYKDIKLFFSIFIIAILIYGQKLFFYSLACDDYALFYSQGKEMAENGRWFGGILSQHIFSDSLAVLPYLHGLFSIFSFTLAGFLTAKHYSLNNVIEITIVTLIIATTPMVAHILYFNMAIAGILAMGWGVLGFALLYHKNILFKAFGFILLVLSIGSYQIIIQVTLAIIIFKIIIDLMKVESLIEVKKIIISNLFYVGIIFLAFMVSSMINSLYLEYYNIAVSERYGHAFEALSISDYFNRIKSMYNIKLYLLYTTSPIIWYKAIVILGILSTYIILIIKKIDLKVKITIVVFLTLLYSILPLIVNLPYITGNSIPLRSHFTIGWVIAGFITVQFIILPSIVKKIVMILSLMLLVTQMYYINIFYDATTRQTKLDISLANQIVTRIRMNKDYKIEPLEFRIVGQKVFPVVGWHSYNMQAFGTSWSKYEIFKKFTDFKFQKMNIKEYKDIENYIVSKGSILDDYPAKSSILFYKNKVVLFLDVSTINKKIRAINQK